MKVINALLKEYTDPVNRFTLVLNTDFPDYAYDESECRNVGIIISFFIKSEIPENLIDIKISTAEKETYWKNVFINLLNKTIFKGNPVDSKWLVQPPVYTFDPEGNKIFEDLLDDVPVADKSVTDIADSISGTLLPDDSSFNFKIQMEAPYIETLRAPKSILAKIKEIRYLTSSFLESSPGVVSFSRILAVSDDHKHENLNNIFDEPLIWKDLGGHSAFEFGINFKPDTVKSTLKFMKGLAAIANKLSARYDSASVRIMNSEENKRGILLRFKDLDKLFSLMQPENYPK